MCYCRQWTLFSPLQHRWCIDSCPMAPGKSSLPPHHTNTHTHIHTLSGATGVLPQHLAMDRHPPSATARTASALQAVRPAHAYNRGAQGDAQGGVCHARPRWGASRCLLRLLRCALQGQGSTSHIMTQFVCHPYALIKSSSPNTIFVMLLS